MAQDIHGRDDGENKMIRHFLVPEMANELGNDLSGLLANHGSHMPHQVLPRAASLAALASRSLSQLRLSLHPSKPEIIQP